VNLLGLQYPAATAAAFSARATFMTRAQTDGVLQQPCQKREGLRAPLRWLMGSMFQVTLHIFMIVTETNSTVIVGLISSTGSTIPDVSVLNVFIRGPRRRGWRRLLELRATCHGRAEWWSGMAKCQEYELEKAFGCSSKHQQHAGEY
jgi:hypothetical protein